MGCVTVADSGNIIHTDRKMIVIIIIGILLVSVFAVILNERMQNDLSNVTKSIEEYNVTDFCISVIGKVEVIKEFNHTDPCESLNWRKENE